ncbi:MAG: hypothetical protein ACYDDI_02045 [Candidatus Acidiferrales bacterium]
MPNETNETPDRTDQNLREAHAFAREERAQADTLLWEVSAIIWGGQTLLLGFVLEAINGGRAALVLIIVVAVIGIFMASFNDRITNKRSEVCQAMVEVMTGVENQLEMPIKPQQIITKSYGRGFQREWSQKLNWCFRLAWGIVVLVALCRLIHPIFGTLGRL